MLGAGFRGMPNAITDNGDKGIPVVVAKRREKVTLPTDFDGFRESQFSLMIFYPEGLVFS